LSMVTEVIDGFPFLIAHAAAGKRYLILRTIRP
jgi:hypothetical protein